MNEQQAIHARQQRIKREVSVINARATRRTEDIRKAWRDGHITRAEQDQALAIEYRVSDIQVRQARRGQ